MNRLSTVNETAIFWLAAAIETSICVWTFLILPLIPLAWPAAMPSIQFISSGVLQLVALPVLAVASKKSSAGVQRLIQETHDAALAQITGLREMVAEIHEMHREIHTILSIESEHDARSDEIGD